MLCPTLKYFINFSTKQNGKIMYEALYLSINFYEISTNKNLFVPLDSYTKRHCRHF